MNRSVPNGTHGGMRGRNLSLMRNFSYSIEYNGAYVCAVFKDDEGNITGGDFTMARDDDSGYIPALKPGESATIEVRVQNLTGGEPEFLICWN